MGTLRLSVAAGARYEQDVTKGETYFADCDIHLTLWRERCDWKCPSQQHTIAWPKWGSALVVKPSPDYSTRAKVTSRARERSSWPAYMADMGIKDQSFAKLYRAFQNALKG